MHVDIHGVYKVRIGGLLEGVLTMPHVGFLNGARISAHAILDKSSLKVRPKDPEPQTGPDSSAHGFRVGRLLLARRFPAG